MPGAELLKFGETSRVAPVAIPSQAAHPARKV